MPYIDISLVVAADAMLRAQSRFSTQDWPYKTDRMPPVRQDPAPKHATKRSIDETQRVAVTEEQISSDTQPAGKVVANSTSAGASAESGSTNATPCRQQQNRPHASALATPQNTPVWHPQTLVPVQPTQPTLGPQAPCRPATKPVTPIVALHTPPAHLPTPNESVAGNKMGNLSSYSVEAQHKSSKRARPSKYDVHIDKPLFKAPSQLRAPNLPPQANVALNHGSSKQTPKRKYKYSIDNL